MLDLRPFIPAKDFSLSEQFHSSLDWETSDVGPGFRHVSSVLRNDRFPGARVQPPKLQPYGGFLTFVHDPTGVLLHLCQWK